MDLEDWLDAYKANSRIRRRCFDAGYFSGALHVPSRCIWAADRIMVPAYRIREVILQHHSNPSHGHWELRKTCDILDCKFLFLRMEQLVA